MLLVLQSTLWGGRHASIACISCVWARLCTWWHAPSGPNSCRQLLMLAAAFRSAIYLNTLTQLLGLQGRRNQRKGNRACVLSTDAQSRVQGNQTDFTHIQGLSLYTRAANSGTALVVDLSG